MKEKTPIEPDNTVTHLTTRDPAELMPLERLQQEVEGYSGKILVRLPRTLHRRLAEAAEIEGVSLNQYILYKLSRD